MFCQSYVYGLLSIKSYQSDIIDAMSYLISIGDKRIVIDPHEDADMLSDLNGAYSLTVILTHEHFDHISGVNWLRTHFDVTVFASKTCADRIARPKNGTELFPLLLIGDKEAYKNFKNKYPLPYHCRIDQPLSGDENWRFGDCHIRIFETPGHSFGGISVLINGSILFAGDSLLGNGEEFRSIDSDIEIYKSVSLPKYICLLPCDITVFPGHGSPGKLLSILEKQGFSNGN